MNPVWHVHNSRLPKENSIMSFSMLLNLVETSNADNKELLWKFVKKYKSKVIGYACLINRSSKQSLKIKDKNIVSQIKLEIPTYKKNVLPIELKKIPITKPGSRYLK